jgi:rhodanese-related sulfurtransferase
MADIIVELKKSLYSFLGIIALTLPALALAGPQTPESLSGTTVVTAEQAKSMVEKGTLIVDTRVANEYVEQHIKGAVSIPYKEKSAKSVDFDASMDSFDLSKLPVDKGTPAIFYCNAGECWKSYKSSKTAVKAGSKNVYWLRGGIPEWKAKGFPVE